MPYVYGGMSIFMTPKKHKKTPPQETLRGRMAQFGKQVFFRPD
jgi:hypothetical protein